MTKTTNTFKTQAALLAGVAEGVRKVYTTRKAEVTESETGKKVAEAVSKAKVEAEQAVTNTHKVFHVVVDEIGKDFALVKAEALKAAKEAQAAKTPAPSEEPTAAATKDPNHAPEVIAEVTRVGHVWSIAIPELDLTAEAKSYADVQGVADHIAAEALNVKEDEVNVFVIRVAADAEPTIPEGPKVDPEYAKVTQEKTASSFADDPVVKEVRAKLLASGLTLLNRPEVREVIRQAAKKRYPRR